MTEFLGDDFLVNRTTGNRSMLVAVKMLRRNADDLARYDILIIDKFSLDQFIKL